MRIFILGSLFLALGCDPKVESVHPEPSTNDTAEAPTNDTGDGADTDDPDGDDTGGSSGDDTGDGEVVPVDEDGDGVSVDDGDCDDTRSDVYPDAEELCDEVDNDCDGEVDEGVTLVFYADVDADGYGDALSSVEACEAPESFVDDSTDCDDSSDVVNPGATEVCDEQDNDCDSSIDEDVETTWYLDFDADGFGGSDFTWDSCEAPIGYVASSDDCDDTSVSAYPGAMEVCDEEDNNCDGVVDEGLTSTYFRDADSDGHGDYEISIDACDLPPGYAVSSDDCNDLASHTHPGATEICDGEDNDCDVEIDEEPGEGAPVWYGDGDGDGYAGDSVSLLACSRPDGWMSMAYDCDDADSSIYPGADEYCDGLDNDCDGSVDEFAVDFGAWYGDGDGDGYGDPASVIYSCTPGLGYVADGTDCDDTSTSAYPGGTETCDGLDNDCNGVVDDDASDGFLVYVDADGDGHGDPFSASTVACELTIGTSDLADDCDDSDEFRSPSEAEIECNGVDEDCDGEDFCLSTCGDGVVDDGEEIEIDSDVYSFISVDSDTCRWNFSSVQQLYCNGSCTWAGGSSCDDADADILCQLLTDNPASTALSWTATTALAEPGFPCPGYGTTISTDRGVSVPVYYQDTSILDNHGPGDVVAYPMCTDP